MEGSSLPAVVPVAEDLFRGGDGGPSVGSGGDGDSVVARAVMVVKEVVLVEEMAVEMMW